MSPILSFIVFTFGAFGLAWVIGHSTLTQPLRDAWLREISGWNKMKHPDLRCSAETAANAPPGSHVHDGNCTFGTSWLLTLLECPGCLGFWIGLGYAFTSGSSLRDAVELGFYTTAVNFVLGRLTGIVPHPLEKT